MANLWLLLVPLWTLCATIVSQRDDREELIKTYLKNNPLLIDYFHCLYELSPHCPLSPEAIKGKYKSIINNNNELIYSEKFGKACDNRMRLVR